MGFVQLLVADTWMPELCVFREEVAEAGEVRRLGSSGYSMSAQVE